MEPSLATVFALLTAVAGWFYLFYSKAAHRLAEVEQEHYNRTRIRLRRAGGVLMLLLAVLFFAGSHTINPDMSPGAYVACWLGVLVLLAGIIVLALVDVRLTTRLRKRRPPGGSPNPPR